VNSWGGEEAVFLRRMAGRGFAPEAVRQVQVLDGAGAQRDLPRSIREGAHLLWSVLMSPAPVEVRGCSGTRPGFVTRRPPAVLISYRGTRSNGIPDRKVCYGSPGNCEVLPPQPALGADGPEAPGWIRVRLPGGRGRPVEPDAALGRVAR